MSDPKTTKLTGLLHKEKDGTFSMYFCRGAGKCTKTLYEQKKMSRKKQVCGDCIKGEDGETLENVLTRINRGDA